jgi:hypothetical protein
MARASIAGHVLRLVSILLVPLSVVSLSGVVVQVAYVDEASYRLVSLISRETGVGYSVSEVRVPVEVTVKPGLGVLVESVVDPYTGLEIPLTLGSPVWLPGGFYYFKTVRPDAGKSNAVIVIDVKPAPRLVDIVAQATAGVLAITASLVLWRVSRRLAWQL